MREQISRVCLRRTIIHFGFILILSFSSYGFPQSGEEADHLFALGDSCYYRGEYEESIKFYHLALDIYLDIKDNANVSKALNDIGVSFRKMGEFDSAKIYYDQALSLDLLVKDTLRIVNRYFNLSNLSIDRGNYSQAGKLMIDALSLARKKGYSRSVANLNSSLGILYANQEDFMRALDYHRLAMLEYRVLNDSARYSLVLNNIGNCFSELGEWDSAFYYLRDALEIKRQLKDLNSEAFTLHNLGSLFYSLESFDSAEYYLNKAYLTRKEIVDSYGVAYTGNELGQLYLTIGRPELAITYLLEAKEYAETEKNYSILIENIDALNDYYLMVGDTVRAYEALNRWSILKDSLFNNERVKVMEYQSAIELDRKEEERRLQEEEALNQSKIAEQRLMIIAGVTVAAVILLILILYVIRQRARIKRLNDNLKLINRDMYHRKKNDYMRLLNEISAVNVPISEDIRGQLLASAAVDESLYEEEADQVELSDYLEERLEDIGDAQGFRSKGVSLEFSVSRVWISGQKATAILLVLNELITNSIKHSFAETQGTIHITIDDSNDKLRVLFKDDGTPFPEVSKSHGMGQQIISQVLKTLRTELVRDVQDQWNLSSFEIKVS